MTAFALPQDWKTSLQAALAAKETAALQGFLDAELAAGKTVFPPQTEWFRALELTPLDKVRVVILGQDPYHGPGQAHGLCFSVPPGVRTPPSLSNIYKELGNDLGLPRPNHGFLEHWARQGVLLLNSVLTVEMAKAASHSKKGWEQFVIEASIKTSCQHFIYNKPPFCNINNYEFINGYTLECFDASGGVMMFYTKAVIEKVGGFYTGYELYGFEHIGHSMRIKRAQFTPDWFVSIEGLSDYIHSYDYDVPKFFLEKSCIEEDRKWELSQKNRNICNSEDLEIYRPIIV
jgi:uracil-DNA glycosylase